jgi:glutathione S-transferase
MGLVAARLRAQRDRGRETLVGDALSAADIAWACFAALLQPLPEALCPMSAGMRASYTARHPRILEALDPILLEHRDRVYERALELPVQPGA